MSFDLTNRNISDTFQNLTQVTGSDNSLYKLDGTLVENLRISGSLIAQQYVVSSSVTNVSFVQESGSTIFGDSMDDTHFFSGSIHLGDDSSTINFDDGGTIIWDPDGEDRISIRGANGQIKITSGSGFGAKQLLNVSSSDGDAHISVNSHTLSSDITSKATLTVGGNLLITGSSASTRPDLEVIKNDTWGSGEIAFRIGRDNAGTISNDLKFIPNFSGAGLWNVTGIYAPSDTLSYPGYIVMTDKRISLKFGQYAYAYNTVVDYQMTSTPTSGNGGSTVGTITSNLWGANIDHIFKGQSDNNLLYLDAGQDKVGIGKQPTAASKKLEVAGDISASGDLYLREDGNSNTDIIMDTSGDNYDTQIFFHKNGSNKWKFQNDNSENLFAFYDFSHSEKIFTITGSRFGIGTSTPTKKLEVAGDISQSGNFITQGHITASGNISSSGHMYQHILYNDGGAQFNYANKTNTFLIKGLADSLLFVANPSGNDKVGIGLNPSVNNSKFQVGGDISTTSHITASGNISASGDLHISGTISASHDIRLIKNKKLDFKYANNSTTYIYSPATNRLDLVAGGTLNTIIKSDRTILQQNVGINTGITSTPSNALEVNGDISASGDLHVDGTPYVGWHGSSTRIKILPRDFAVDDNVGRPLFIEDDTTGDLSIRTYGTNDSMYATIPIPQQYTASAVMVYGSDGTNAVSCSEGFINTPTIVSGGAGSVGTEFSIGQISSSATNFLWVKVETTAASDLIYGGYVTITKP